MSKPTSKPKARVTKRTQQPNAPPATLAEHATKPDHQYPVVFITQSSSTTAKVSSCLALLNAESSSNTTSSSSSTRKSNNVVAITSVNSSAATRTISVAEIIKRKVAESEDKFWYQYTQISSKLIEWPPAPKHKTKTKKRKQFLNTEKGQDSHRYEGSGVADNGDISMIDASGKRKSGDNSQHDAKRRKVDVSSEAGKANDDTTEAMEAMEDDDDDDDDESIFGEIPPEAVSTNVADNVGPLNHANVSKHDEDEHGNNDDEDSDEDEMEYSRLEVEPRSSKKEVIEKIIAVGEVRQKVRAIPILTIFLSKSPNAELAKLYGEQSNFKRLPPTKNNNITTSMEL